MPRACPVAFAPTSYFFATLEYTHASVRDVHSSKSSDGGRAVAAAGQAGLPVCCKRDEGDAEGCYELR